MKRFSQKTLQFVALLLSIFWGLIACDNSVNIERSQPLPQDPFIEVYFNLNQAKGANYSDPYRNIDRPGDNLENIIINTINSAQSTIDLAVQEFRLPNIAKALVQQAEKGIKVRIILENTYNQSLANFTPEMIANMTIREKQKYEQYFNFIDIDNDQRISQKELNERDVFTILNQENISIIDDTEDGSKGTGLMHHKFIIIDGKVIIVSSANFTLSGIHGDFNNNQTRGNANNLLKIESSELAQLFTEEFNLMWGDGKGGKKDSQFGINKLKRSPKTITIGTSQVTVKFSPNSSKEDWQLTTNGLISSILNQAQNSINLALFVFSDQNIANTLERKNNQGIKIKALIDPEFIFRYYSEGLDMLGVSLSNNCKYEMDNQPWKQNINTVGVANLPQGDKLHHKFAIIDDNIIITGSHNWSASANYQNDETLLVIKNSLITDHYQQEFDKLYNNSSLGISKNINNKIQEDIKNCPTLLTQKSQKNVTKIINLNTASLGELETLPGIGKSLGERIIEVREIQPFTSLEDLTRVKGIGKSKIQQLEGKVSW
ncbi:MAG: phospholipase D-like domain-containing protein [Crocosphaera sp.]|nr:phospholipase D-like domain-containing protein [Crocosphaera sp.]